MRIHILFLLLALACPASGVWAQTPDNPIAVCGHIQADPPLNGDLSLSFRIYDQATEGSLLWEQADMVEIVDGTYDTVLGGGSSPLADSLFDQSPLYLETRIWLPAQGRWEILGPRRQVLAAPHAVNAKRMDGKDSAALVTASGGSVAGDIAVSGKLSMGTGIGPYRVALYDEPDHFYGLGTQFGRITFTTDNQEAMTLTDTGRLGIGISSPAYTMDIQGGSMVLRASVLPGAKEVGLGNDADGAKLYALAADLFVQSTSGDTLLMPDSAKVGIDVATPEENLDVNGTIMSTGTADDPSLRLGNTSGMEWRIVSYSDGNLNMWNGGNRLSIDSAGNVGIGNPNPEAKLHVNGNLKVTGSLEVTGVYSGNFPPPDYDSGWVTGMDAGETRSLSHNLGGDVEDYVVQLVLDDGYTRTNMQMGTDRHVPFNGDLLVEGAHFKNLTNTTIEVYIGRHSGGYIPRILIWRQS